jgi:hypothetical protein
MESQRGIIARKSATTHIVSICPSIKTRSKWRLLTAAMASRPFDAACTLKRTEGRESVVSTASSAQEAKTTYS